MKNRLIDYKEEEFTHLIEEAFSGKLSEERLGEISDFFDNEIAHPDGCDLVFYTKECGIEESPIAIVAEIKRYYAEHDLPCFKE